MKLQLIILSTVSGYLIKDGLTLAYGYDRSILNQMKEVKSIYSNDSKLDNELEQDAGVNNEIEIKELENFLGTLSFKMKRLVDNHKTSPTNTHHKVPRLRRRRNKSKKQVKKSVKNDVKRNHRFFFQWN